MKNLAAIQIEDLYKHFEGAESPTLCGMNLELAPGTIHCLLGHSGSGKSVTLRHVLGLVSPDRGRVLIQGQNIDDCSAVELVRLRRKFGMLFQNSALFDSLTVQSNIAFPLREHRSEWGEEKILRRVDSLLESVNLSNCLTKMPSELSGGMKKRVGLARAIALDPEILLFDEPTTGLDPQTAQVIDDLIASTSRRLKASSLIISHDIHAALRIADFVSMIWEGRVIETDTPENFVKSEHPVLRQFLESAGVI